MSRRTALTLAVMLASCAAGTEALAGGRIELPEVRRVTLDNGTLVLLVPHREVPMVAFEAVLRGGSALDPPGKEGLAGFTAAMVRKGAGGSTAEQLADQMDGLGAALTLAVDEDATWMGLELLSRDASTGVGLLADLVMRPDFPSDEVEKLRARTIDGITAAKEDPRGVIGLYFAAALFGDHPYGRPGTGTETTVATFTANDVQSFHAAQWGGDRLILAVGGDFDVDQMEAELKERFGGWHKAAAPLPPIAAPTPVTGRRVVLVDSPGATQTYFIMGNVGEARTQANREPLDLVHVLFGGRFTSMLNTALRIESGLTYGARVTRSEHVQPGSVAMWSYTETSHTAEAIDLALATLQRLHDDGLAPAAIESGKAYTRGQMPTTLETSSQVTEKIAELAFFGLPDDSVEGYLSRLDAVTPEAAREVIRTRVMDPANLVFVLIGDAARIREVAARYGPVTEKKITDPGF